MAKRNVEATSTEDKVNAWRDLSASRRATELAVATDAATPAVNTIPARSTTIHD
jgi:hypothetical protein